MAQLALRDDAHPVPGVGGLINVDALRMLLPSATWKLANRKRLVSLRYTASARTGRGVAGEPLVTTLPAATDSVNEHIRLVNLAADRVVGHLEAVAIRDGNHERVLPCVRTLVGDATRGGAVRVDLLYPEVYDMARFREERKEFPPFGVLYLAAALRQAGHDVGIRKVTKHSPPLDLRGLDAVGFSLASSATYGIMLQARATAVVDAQTLVMVGGVHANFYPRECLVDFDADVVSYGESDETILELVVRAHTRQFGDIPGLMWRDRGQLRVTPAAKVGRDISHLPLPARDLLDTEDFVMGDRLAGRDVRMAHVMFSRGCPFPCTFCAAGQTRIQYRNGASARVELESLIDTYAVEGFAIVDDNFIVNKASVRDICTSIADLKLSWSALSRVDTVQCH